MIIQYGSTIVSGEDKGLTNLLAELDVEPSVLLDQSSHALGCTLVEIVDELSLAGRKVPFD